jgi:hypothetical protein
LRRGLLNQGGAFAKAEAFPQRAMIRQEEPDSGDILLLVIVLCVLAVWWAW